MGGGDIVKYVHTEKNRGTKNHTVLRKCVRFTQFFVMNMAPVGTGMPRCIPASPFFAGVLTNAPAIVVILQVNRGQVQSKSAQNYGPVVYILPQWSKGRLKYA